MPIGDGCDSAEGSDGTLAARIRYDRDRFDELVEAVVFAIADAEGVLPIDVRSPPLGEVVDIEALERTLFPGREVDPDRAYPASFAFEYDGYVVRVGSDGWIDVSVPDPDRD